MTVLKMTDLDLKGKRVLIREDLNVPVKDGQVQSDARIKAALPTLKLALEKGAAVMVCSPRASVLVMRRVSPSQSSRSVRMPAAFSSQVQTRENAVCSVGAGVYSAPGSSSGPSGASSCSMKSIITSISRCIFVASASRMNVTPRSGMTMQSWPNAPSPR